MKAATDTPPPAGGVNRSDAQHMADTLAWLGERGHDIAPEVFTRYLAQHPESAALFRVIDPSQPPHGCGQMVFEMLSVLQDSAEGKPYVAGYLQDLVTGHKAFGVHGWQVYADFLQSLAQTIDARMAERATHAQRAAW